MRARALSAIPPSWGVVECANLVPNRIAPDPILFGSIVAQADLIGKNAEGRERN
jgi:hypothetical protein